MPHYTTKVTALVNGELYDFAGPNIEAISWAHAERYCQENGLGYCVIDGVLQKEINDNGETIDYRNEN